jgi:hypothetical protein
VVTGCTHVAAAVGNISPRTCLSRLPRRWMLISLLPLIFCSRLIASHKHSSLCASDQPTFGSPSIGDEFLSLLVAVICALWSCDVVLIKLFTFCQPQALPLSRLGKLARLIHTQAPLPPWTDSAILRSLRTRPSHVTHRPPESSGYDCTSRLWA